MKWLKRQHSLHFHIISKHILAMKLFQLDDEVYIHFLGVHLFHQFAGGFHCSTGCQQVVV
ncbi:unknown [Bacteroides uniformis CAG:3]|nr:unknown [Bacteroides uniformis CAG:3]